MKCGGATRPGFSMAEMIMAMFLVALFSAVALIGFSGFAGGYKFRSTTNQIISMFSTSATASSENGRRYGILFDFIDLSYTLYEVKTDNPYSEDFANLLEEDVIDRGFFGNDCQLLYIQFDDGEMIDGGEQGRTLFVVGRAGWDFGGKIVLANYDGDVYTIIISRLAKIPVMVEGDAEIAQPVYDMMF